MMLIIPLGVQTIQFGENGDPDRIKKMVGTFDHDLDKNLNPDRFADKGELLRKGRGIANWGEGTKEVELLVACLKRYVHNYDALLDELSQLPPDLQKASFPHLSGQLSLSLKKKWESFGEKRFSALTHRTRALCGATMVAVYAFRMCIGFANSLTSVPDLSKTLCSLAKLHLCSASNPWGFRILFLKILKPLFFYQKTKLLHFYKH